MPGRPNLGSEFPLSNNTNRNSNRRRGRGSNRSQGGSQLNRIDSRARGNAPQMLEKYRKLAQDSALNGDRVQAEYYLQFADHYFRVIADSRVAKDETRGPRREFEQGSGEEQDYFEDEFDRGQRQEPSRREEPRSDQRADESGEQAGRGNEGPDREAGDYESAKNPFTRPSRDKPRRNSRERPEFEEAAAGDRLDPSALPGAIGRDESDAPETAAEPVDEAPAPARRSLKPRRNRSRPSGDDEELEAVG